MQPPFSHGRSDIILNETKARSVAQVLQPGNDTTCMRSKRVKLGNKFHLKFGFPQMVFKLAGVPHSRPKLLASGANSHSAPLKRTVIINESATRHRKGDTAESDRKMFC